MIEKVFILNLDRCVDRLIFSVSQLTEAGTPWQRIEKYPAIDNHRFEKTLDVMDAMIADGFSQASQWFDNQRYQQYPIAYFCQGWSYVRFFRYIAEANIIGLLIQDRKRLRVPFDFLDAEITKLIENDPNFKLASLHCRCFPKYMPEFVCETSHWVYGTHAFSAPDWAMVITPSGGELILEHIFDFQRPLLDEFLQHCQSFVKNRSVYSLAGYSPDIPMKRLRKLLLEDTDAYVGVGFSPPELKSIIHTSGEPIRPIQTTI